MKVFFNKALIVLLSLSVLFSFFGCDNSGEIKTSETYKPKTSYSKDYRSEETDSRTVYIAPTGKRYHYKSTCAGKNAMPIELDDVSDYYDACKKCVH